MSSILERMRAAVGSGRRLAHNEARLLLELYEAVERWRENPERWAAIAATPGALAALRDIDRSAEAISTIGASGGDLMSAISDARMALHDHGVTVDADAWLAEEREDDDDAP